MAVQIGATFNGRATIAAMSRLQGQVDAATAVAIRRSGAVVERAAKLKLSENGRHERGTPTPSAPGEPPAIITSTLRASVKVGTPRRLGFGAYEVMVGPTVVYGRVQELGGGNLPARPYMAPSLAESQDEAYKVFAESWRAAITGGVLR